MGEIAKIARIIEEIASVIDDVCVLLDEDDVDEAIDRLEDVAIDCVAAASRLRELAAEASDE